MTTRAVETIIHALSPLLGWRGRSRRRGGAVGGRAGRRWSRGLGRGRRREPRPPAPTRIRMTDCGREAGSSKSDCCQGHQQSRPPSDGTEQGSQRGARLRQPVRLAGGLRGQWSGEHGLSRCSFVFVGTPPIERLAPVLQADTALHARVCLRQRAGRVQIPCHGKFFREFLRLQAFGTPFCTIMEPTLGRVRQSRADPWEKAMEPLSVNEIAKSCWRACRPPCAARRPIWRTISGRCSATPGKARSGHPRGVRRPDQGAGAHPRPSGGARGPSGAVGAGLRECRFGLMGIAATFCRGPAGAHRAAGPGRGQPGRRPAGLQHRGFAGHGREGEQGARAGEL